jgi:hypothetical protein
MRASKTQIHRKKLNKGFIGVYKENYKPLKKEIKEKEVYRGWKNLPCLLIGIVIIVKVTVLPTAIYIPNAISSKPQ